MATRRKHATHALGDFRKDESGTVAIMGAAFAVAAIGFSALVVDLGHVHLARRHAQGVTDLAAIVAARDVAVAAPAAAAMLVNNPVTLEAPISVVVGSYRADPTLNPDQRFVPNAIPANAVRVDVHSVVPLFFARVFTGHETWSISTTATAAASRVASFSIGSRLASLNAGVANAILSDLVGGQVSLSAMDYRALADVQVDLFRFLDRLATSVNATGGTYSSLAETEVSVAGIIAAVVAAGVIGDDAHAALIALDKLAQLPRVDTMRIPAGELIDLGPYGALIAGEGAGLQASLSVFQLVSGAITAANGDRQVVVDLTSAVPGLASVKATIIVGERPQGSSWVSVGDAGATVYTAQTRVRIDVEILGTGLLLGRKIKLPILLDIASGTGTLDEVVCGDDPTADGRIRVAARPAVAEVWVGEPTPPSGWTDFSAPPTVGAVEIVNVLGVARVNAGAHAAISNHEAIALTFSWNDIAVRSVKTVSTIQPVDTLLTSLVANTELDVTILGFSLIPKATIANLVAGLLAPVGPKLDQIVIGLLDALGVRIGEADLWANGLRCDGSVLVQ